jgi:hypothetical protein
MFVPVEVFVWRCEAFCPKLNPLQSCMVIPG